MKRILAFFRLIRWPNLVFVVLTQFLFAYRIVLPIYQESGHTPIINGSNFWLLTLSSVCIAAAGYIINDYFDIAIDQINKPDKMVIGKYIHRHWAMAAHITLSIIGIGIGFYLDFTTEIRLLGLCNIIATVLLFFYSFLLKRKPISGNILVAIMTAWTILIITFSESIPLIHVINQETMKRITRYTFLYAGFAFVISIIREVIKDMEDVDGDRKFGCNTMPIAFGMNAAKIFALVWLIVLLGMLFVLDFYMVILHWFVSLAYCTIFLILPAAWVMSRLLKANTQTDYHRLSNYVKYIMFLGILSMAFISLGI